MNPLIQKLWQQAKFNDGRYPVPHEVEQNFAELLVREAARVAGRDVEHFVLEHFGVDSE